MDWTALWIAAEQSPYGQARTIVADLQRDYSRWCDSVRAFELAASSSNAIEPNSDAEGLQREVQALAVDIESYVAEINYLGIPLDVQDLFQEEL